MALLNSIILCALALLVSGSSMSGIPPSLSFREQCLSLPKKLTIPNANNPSSTFIPANTTIHFPETDTTCSRSSQHISTDLCRVSLQASTSPRSRLKLETWLPSPDHWTGRFLSTGNGGMGGCIQYEDIEYATSLGFAAVGTNNGHDGMSGESFLHNPDVIEDFAYRALRNGVVLGKEITRTFYGRAHNKSYYLGCSTGGRQGFKEVQDFPGDFDGVVVGAPAVAFNNLTSWSCRFLTLTGPVGDDTFIPMDIWGIIHRDVLDQCDGLDGVKDGILESPDLCNYNPDGLLCRAGQTNKCLTAPQIQALRKAYSPLFSVDNSTLVYPELQPGAELTGAPQTYFTGRPFGAADWFRYAIFNDSAWDPFSLKPEDYVISSQLNLFNIETWEGDLSAFRERGGKILHYHGLADGTISSSNSPRYYKHVAQTMGLSPAELDDFYRLFRISGMAHCGGGPGAAFIGNSKRNTAGLGPDENVLMAVVRWVEEGIPPDTITGTAYVNGTQSTGVDFRRRHCRWPYRNVYKGVGNGKDEESWECV